MKKLLKGLGVGLFWLALWECAYLAVGKSILVPSPGEVASVLAGLCLEPKFWAAAFLSLWRVTAGFVLGVAAGGGLAVLTAVWPPASALLRPMIAVIRATPVASFIILALVWLKTGQVPAFTAFLIVLPLVWANVEKGIASADPALLEMASAYKMPPWTRLTKLWLPSVRPYLESAAITGLGMAWKAGVAAEVIVMPKNSIGSALHDAKIYLDTPGLFAWTLVVIALSMALERILLFAAAKGRGRAHAEA